MFRKRASGDEQTIFFATDLHGSNVCFKKFINAGKFYGAGSLILGGDVRGVRSVAAKLPPKAQQPRKQSSAIRFMAGLLDREGPGGAFRVRRSIVETRRPAFLIQA